MNRKSNIFLYLLLLIVLVFAFIRFPLHTLYNPVIELNPYDRNPLCAQISFTSVLPSKIMISVKGRNGAKDIQHTFSKYKINHKIPVLGLYPEYKNTVLLTAIYKGGLKLSKEINIQTPKIEERVELKIQQKNDKKSHYYYLTDGVVFDEDGYIRFSFNNAGGIVYFLNNELILESRMSGLIRFTLLGEEKQRYPYPENFASFTHGLGRKPNGNFLVIGSFRDSFVYIDNVPVPSHRDFVIEIDYKTGKIVNKIDLAELLNPQRAVIVKKNFIDYGMNDWCHINGVDYDTSDESIVVSCRHSGIIKIDEKTSKLKWIISPNKGFEKSGRKGNGGNISNKVLTAVDKNGKPYKKEIQMGAYSNDIFKWPTVTHNLKVFPDNIIAVYDNAGRINDPAVYSTKNSNAMLYKIDEKSRTVEQFWRESLNHFAEFGSSVLYYPKEKEVVSYSSIIPAKNQKQSMVGEITRYDFDTHKILFSVLLDRKQNRYYYRNEIFQFYPEEE